MAIGSPVDGTIMDTIIRDIIARVITVHGIEITDVMWVGIEAADEVPRDLMEEEGNIKKNT
jgi:hypothetical protein